MFRQESPSPFFEIDENIDHGIQTPPPSILFRTPASQICKLWEVPFFRGSWCDLKRNAAGGRIGGYHGALGLVVG